MGFSQAKTKGKDATVSAKVLRQGRTERVCRMEKGQCSWKGESGEPLGGTSELFRQGLWAVFSSELLLHLMDSPPPSVPLQIL